MVFKKTTGKLYTAIIPHPVRLHTILSKQQQSGCVLNFNKMGVCRKSFQRV